MLTGWPVAPSLSDWKDYVATHPAVAAKAPMPPERVADLTTKAQMVVAHPGWQMFLDRLASRRDLAVMTRGQLERAILDGDGGIDVGLKLQLREIKGLIAGLEFASSIIPEMIDAGETMLQGLIKGETVGAATR